MTNCSRRLVAAAFLVATLLQSTSAFLPSHVALTISKSVQGSSPLTSKSNLNLRMTSDPIAKKETTWDRITGPKLFKTVTNWNGIHSVPLVPLRIVTGLLMIHHGTEGFIDFIIKPYFSFLPGPPEAWSAIHDYTEFFGGILFSLGFLTRPAALALLVTMLSAIYFHLSASGLQGFPLGHVPNYSYDFEEPMLYALVFLMFWFNGAGPLSIDSIIYKKISMEEE